MEDGHDDEHVKGNARASHNHGSDRDTREKQLRLCATASC